MGLDDTSKPSQAVDIEQEQTFEKNNEPLVWYQVATPSIAFIGVQLAWAIQIGTATAAFRKLGVPDTEVNFAWLAGPVSGVLVQPLVGVLSDRCKSKLGRRRPFIIAGGLATAVTQVIFIRANAIAKIILHEKAESSSLARFLALITFWILDISINFIQGPLRALLTDTVPSVQLPLGNSFFAVANGLGKVIGYGLGAVSSDFVLIYTISSCLVCVFTLLTFFLVKERPQGPHEGPSDEESQNDEETEEIEVQSTRSVFKTGLHIIQESLKGISTMPKEMKGAFKVQFFSYFAFMCLFIYGADWVAKDIMGGDAEAPVTSVKHKLFDQGIRAANMGFLLMGAISIVLGPSLPIALRICGVKPVWFFTQILFSLALFLTPLITNVAGVVIILGLLSIPLAAAFTIPWAIVTSTLRHTLQRERCLYTATFNLSQAMPGVVVSLISGRIVKMFGGNISVVLALGGMAAFISALFTMFLEVPDRFSYDTGNRSGGAKLENDTRDARKIDSSSDSDENYACA